MSLARKARVLICENDFSAFVPAVVTRSTQTSIYSASRGLIAPGPHTTHHAELQWAIYAKLDTHFYGLRTEYAQDQNPFLIRKGLVPQGLVGHLLAEASDRLSLPFALLYNFGDRLVER